MTFDVRNCHKRCISLLLPSSVYSYAISKSFSRYLSTLPCPSPMNSSSLTSSTSVHQVEEFEGLTADSDLDILISKVPVGSSENDVFQSLKCDQACGTIQLSHNLVNRLLHRFKDDWKSALGVFRWAESQPGYKPLRESYDMLVDILGKTKQIENMKALVEEMCLNHLVTLETIAKLMRRLSGAGEWEDAVRTFDDLESFGLEKNTESMNLLIDTLCKEKKVEQARAIFLELKAYIVPNAHTFNIFIHGWCKVNRVDEAYWTIQEMKGHGCHPSVITYSTIIQAYCQQFKFHKVYELLDEMQAQGCPPNVVTYTTILCSLTKSEEFEQAIQIVERMKAHECKPDTLFFNAFIHTLSRAGKVREAINAFEVEMPNVGVPPNTSTYNTLIAMFCRFNREQLALNALSEMENSTHCKPDVQSYYPLLKLCFKNGKLDGLLSRLLDNMVNKQHLSIDESTYTLLIHGLCRGNKSEWAYSLFQEMICKQVTTRYKTCMLLLDEMKKKSMYDAADKIEDFIKANKKAMG